MGHYDDCYESDAREKAKIEQKTNKPFTTAKELCYQAFTTYVADSDDRKRERFENWWAQKVWNTEHRDTLQPELNVYIDGKRYIQAE